MGDDANHHGSAAQYVEVDDEVVRIVDKTLVDQNRFLVAVVGPPGAGKSTTCNTLYHIAFGSKASFFEPSANPTSFTKGLWLLSKEARKNLPADSTWECVDMEGFQVDLMSSWKMAMVLCVLSEICIFCNRDARCDNLFKAATVFERGRKLALQLGMKPITKQIFVQVEEGMEKDQEALVVSKIEEMVPNLKIIPFEIPQIRNKNKKNHEFITFHEEIVEAVKAGLVDKFVFSATEDAAASKTEAVSQLLNAFNEGDYLKSTDMNTELLRADLERIYESELAVIKNTHVSKALKTPVTSTEMTLEEFIGGPVEFKPDYKSSTFYVEGKNDKFLGDWILTQPDFDYRKIYNSYYTDKMAELVAERERELMLQVQKEKDYHADLQRAIEVAKFNLQRHLGTLSFSMSLTKNPDEFIESKKIMEERGVEFKHTVSWDPFYKFYEHEKLCIKGMWDAQVNKAKWKCPVSSQGKLKCKNGHKINEDIVLCTAQIAPDAKGNTKCGGTWYWVDGPLKFAKCRGACGQVQKLPSNVSCFKCGAEAQCEIRPSNYFPVVLTMAKSLMSFSP